MVAAVKFESLVSAVAAKKINFDVTDVFKFALLATANAPNSSTHAVLADLTQIAYTNLVGRTPTIITSAATSGVFSFDLQDFDLVAAGGAVAAFQYVVLYDDTATNKDLVCSWDLGSAITMADTDIVNLVFDTTTLTIT